jgi:hypothetical protein
MSLVIIKLTVKSAPQIIISIAQAINVSIIPKALNFRLIIRIGNYFTLIDNSCDELEFNIVAVLINGVTPPVEKPILIDELQSTEQLIISFGDRPVMLSVKPSLSVAPLFTIIFSEKSTLSITVVGSADENSSAL